MMYSLEDLKEIKFDNLPVDGDVCFEKYHCEYFEEETCAGTDDTCPQVIDWLISLGDEIEADLGNKSDKKEWARTAVAEIDAMNIDEFEKFLADDFKNNGNE